MVRNPIFYAYYISHPLQSHHHLDEQLFHLGYTKALVGVFLPVDASYAVVYVDDAV